MQKKFRIGNPKYGYIYKAINPDAVQNVEECICECTRGSDWAASGQVLYIVYEDGYWVAKDADSVDTLKQGTPVFRSDENILEEGVHMWEIVKTWDIANIEWKKCGTFKTTYLN